MVPAINKKNKYVIGFAVAALAVFCFINGNYYLMVSVLCVLVSVLTTFDKDDPKIKNPKLMQALNLSGYFLAVLIWVYSLYFK